MCYIHTDNIVFPHITVCCPHTNIQLKGGKVFYKQLYENDGQKNNFLVKFFWSCLLTVGLQSPAKQGWAIQGFGQVDMILLKAVLQFSVRYDTDTITETNFQTDTIPIRYLRTIFNPI